MARLRTAAPAEEPPAAPLPPEAAPPARPEAAALAAEAPARTPEAAPKFSDPFSVAKDHAGGVEPRESRRFRQARRKFDARPPQAVLDAVKAAGFRRNGPDQVWTRQINAATALRDRLVAESLFNDVAARLRQDRGLGRGPGSVRRLDPIAEPAGA